MAAKQLITMGVIDPVKVARLALQNAASIAALVLTTDCLISEAPKAAAHPDGRWARRRDGLTRRLER